MSLPKSYVTEIRCVPHLLQSVHSHQSWCALHTITLKCERHTTFGVAIVTSVKRLNLV